MNAKVSFQGLDYRDLSPEAMASAKPCRFGFECPRGRGRCEGLLLVGADLGDGLVTHRVAGQNKPAMWDWDGNIAAPTFSPSINCRSHTDDGHTAAGCGWHGFIKAGKIEGA